jgi:hypothetical protein
MVFNCSLCILIVLGALQNDKQRCSEKINEKRETQEAIAQQQETKRPKTLK